MDEQLLQRLRKRKKVLAKCTLALLVIAVACTFVSLWYAPLKSFLLPVWAAMIITFLGAKHLQRLEKKVQ
ncbi:MAG: hypothetical protein AAB445_01155 [Patescibacteria group bacterium]